MLVGSMGNAQEMVKQAKILAEATSMLVGAIRAESDGQMDADARRRLLDAAKNLADATSRMVEAAKVTTTWIKFGCMTSVRVLLVIRMMLPHKKLFVRLLRVFA